MRTFDVELITPDKTFFEGEVVSLSVTLEDGGMQVLAGHMPSIAVIVPGKCSITLADNSTKIFASNDGVLSISKDGVLLLSDLLEWEEDLSKVLEERYQHIAQEHHRRLQSEKEYRLSEVALRQAFKHLMNERLPK